MADEISRHFAVPFTATAGHVATVEADSAEDITNCVLNLLRTPLGWLEWMPGFGVPDWAFAQDAVDPEEIRAIAEQWDERADVDVARVAQQINVQQRSLNG